MLVGDWNARRVHLSINGLGANASLRSNVVDHSIPSKSRRRIVLCDIFGGTSRSIGGVVIDEASVACLNSDWFLLVDSTAAAATVSVHHVLDSVTLDGDDYILIVNEASLAISSVLPDNFINNVDIELNSIVLLEQSLFLNKVVWLDLLGVSGQDCQERKKSEIF